MHFELSSRCYRRTLRAPIVMSRGRIDERVGVLIRLESSLGIVSFAEVLILPYFSTESLEASLELLEGLDGHFFPEFLSLFPADLRATRFALEAAYLLQTDPDLQATSFQGAAHSDLAVSYLLPAAEQSIDGLRVGLAEGFSTFKWKIGVNPFVDEQAMFVRLCEALPPEARLRLDANAGLNIDNALRWIDLCAGRQVEFIEQPLPVAALDETLDLAARSPIPIALDESVATMEDIDRVYAAGWRGIYVVKPSRLAELGRFLIWRGASKSDIVYSSALETAVGTELGLRLAASDSDNRRAVGYGVNQWFHEDGLNVHPATPQLQAGAVDVAAFETLWNALPER